MPQKPTPKILTNPHPTLQRPISPYSPTEIAKSPTPQIIKNLLSNKKLLKLYTQGSHKAPTLYHTLSQEDQIFLDHIEHTNRKPTYHLYTSYAWIDTNPILSSEILNLFLSPTFLNPIKEILILYDTFQWPYPHEFPNPTAYQEILIQRFDEAHQRTREILLDKNLK